MRLLLLPIALLLAVPSHAEETDLPRWYKEKALLKSYNSLVVRSNLRRTVIVRLSECDPSTANTALLNATLVLSEAKTFKEVPKQFRDYESGAILREKKIIREEKERYSALLFACQRAKKTSGE